MRTFITTALLGFATASSVQASEEGAGTTDAIAYPDLWPQLTNDQLYEGATPQLESLITQWDVNGDGRVSLAEWLDRVNIGQDTREEILTTHEPDYMWWRDQELVTRTLLSTVHFNEDGRVTWGSELDHLATLTGSASDYIMNHYAASPAAGLTHAEVESFFAGFIYGNLREDTGKDHAETIITRLISKCDDGKAKIETARQIVIATLAKIEGIEIEYGDLFNPVEPAQSWHSLVKTVMVMGSSCDQSDTYYYDTLDDLKDNTDPTKVPRLTSVKWWQNLDTLGLNGFELKYDNDYTQEEYHPFDYENAYDYAEKYSIEENDYMTGLSFRTSDIVNSILIETHSGESYKYGDYTGDWTSVAFDAQDPMIIGFDFSEIQKQYQDVIGCMKVHYIDRADLQ